jgi:nucleoid DNA-binding protein
MYKNFNEIIKEVANKLNCSQQIVDEIVKNQFETVRQTIESPEPTEIRLKYIGTFKVRKASKLLIKNKEDE